MPGTLTKLFVAATLLLSGGIASADSWRGPANPTPAPAPVQIDARDQRGTDRADRFDRNDRSERGGRFDRDDRNDRSDRFDRDERSDRDRLDRDRVPPQARVEHDRPRRGFTWIAGQRTRQHGRWAWQPGHYERVQRGRF